MAYDITVEHPAYCEFKSAWELMRDAFDGEDSVKEAGEKYLPMKSGTRAIKDPVQRQATYDAYKLRAEFPELVAPTIRGAAGIILKKSAKVELPKSMEPLLERATLDGLTLEGLHRRIVVELMAMGRYGLLPGITKAGEPYLAGYVTESIPNWDSTDNVEDYVVLDETGNVRDRETGKWGKIERRRECYLNEAGAYVSREWTKNAKGEWEPGKEVTAATRRGAALNIVPFVFIGTNDLTAAPDDVPLYGLGRIAVRIYRLDADYTFSMHMTSEPTPYVTGFEDPAGAVKEGKAPTGIGASTLWVLPPNSDAGFLEFTGAGIDAQKEAIADALNRAVAFGSQVLTDTKRTAESGDAIKLRLGNQTSLLHLIAINSAAGLEKALRNVALWTGEDPEAVTVTPNLEFFDEPITPQEIDSIVKGWQANAYSWTTAFDRFKKGGLIPAERTADEERDLILQEPFLEAEMEPTPPRSAVAEKLEVPDGP